MTARVEDKSLGDAWPDVVASFEMPFRCEVQGGCDNEVAWYGDQHGCAQAYLCDFHMAEFVVTVQWDLATVGGVGCARCERGPVTFDSFIVTRPV